jgi:hypothetical protein
MTGHHGTRRHYTDTENLPVPLTLYFYLAPKMGIPQEIAALLGITTLEGMMRIGNVWLPRFESVNEA